MPPYRAGGGRGGGAAGTMSRKVDATDTQLQEWFSEIAKGTDDVASGVGLAEHRYLWIYIVYQYNVKG